MPPIWYKRVCVNSFQIWLICPSDVQAHIATQTAELIAERTTRSQAIQNRDTIIAGLRLQLDGHKKHRFGSRSESLDQLVLELVLEEHEIAQAAEVSEEPYANRLGQ